MYLVLFVINLTSYLLVASVTRTAIAAKHPCLHVMSWILNHSTYLRIAFFFTSSQPLGLTEIHMSHVFCTFVLHFLQQVIISIIQQV